MPQIAALGEPRAVQYTIRMTATERARFHEVARRRGMTLTDLMRNLLYAEATAAGVDVSVPAAQPQAA